MCPWKFSLGNGKMRGGLCIPPPHSNFSPHLLVLPPPSQGFWASLTLLTSQIPLYFSNDEFNWPEARKQRKGQETAPWGGAVKSGFLDLHRQVTCISRLHCALGLWVISASSHGTTALFLLMCSAVTTEAQDSRSPFISQILIPIEPFLTLFCTLPISWNPFMAFWNSRFINSKTPQLLPSHVL